MMLAITQGLVAILVSGLPQEITLGSRQPIENAETCSLASPKRTMDVTA